MAVNKNSHKVHVRKQPAIGSSLLSELIDGLKEGEIRQVTPLAKSASLHFKTTQDRIDLLGASQPFMKDIKFHWKGDHVWAVEKITSEELNSVSILKKIHALAKEISELLKKSREA